MAQQKKTTSSSAKTIFGANINNLENYVKFVEKNKIEELEINERGIKVLISRKPQGSTVAAAAVPLVAAPQTVGAAPVAAAAESAPATEEPAAASSDTPPSNVHIQTSPIIGTFYESPTPGAPPFVEVGASVNPDTTLCIVEAMKMMNHIKPDVSGKIVKILKKNGDAVKSDEPLFWIET